MERSEEYMAVEMDKRMAMMRVRDADEDDIEALQ